MTLNRLPKNTHVCKTCKNLKRIAYPNDDSKDIKFECSAVLGGMEVNGIVDDVSTWLTCILYLKDNDILRISSNDNRAKVEFLDGIIMYIPSSRLHGCFEED